MDWHYFHVIDVWCYVETDNGVIPGHVTGISMLLTVGISTWVDRWNVFMITEFLEVLESK
jgi:hypothetical protein